MNRHDQESPASEQYKHVFAQFRCLSLQEQERFIIEAQQTVAQAKKPRNDRHRRKTRPLTVYNPEDPSTIPSEEESSR